MQDSQPCEDVSDRWVNLEVVKVDVITVVDVVTAVVVIEGLDKVVVDDVMVSPGDVASDVVVAVDVADVTVSLGEVATDVVVTVGVADEVVASVDADVDVKGMSVVKVELSIALNMTPLPKVIFNVMLEAAKTRITASITRIEIEFTQPTHISETNITLWSIICSNYRL